MRGIEEVHHLAYVNGTAAFYTRPIWCSTSASRASSTSSTPAGITESARCCWPRARKSTSRRRACRPTRPHRSVPDPLNPRLSYGAGKIISEIMAINHGRKHFERVLIFRPHNVYGPDMGFDHVIPQFAVRLKLAMPRIRTALPLSIQGSGEETRSFCHVDDLVAGVMVMREQGRASGHLPRRHHRRDCHRRARPPHGQDRGTVVGALRPSVLAARQHAAPLPRYFEIVRARL